MSAMTTIQGVIAGDLDAYSVASWFTSSYLVGIPSLWNFQDTD